MTDDFEAAKAEYQRALHDYSQLLRHRLANPLTTLIAGISTMQAMEDMDPATRTSLLAAMATQAAELQRVALFPIATRPEEAGLDPRVGDGALDGETLRRELRQRRKGMNEVQFRRINGLLVEEVGDHPRQLIDFVCECSDQSCADILELMLSEYVEVHDHPTRFIVVPGHEDLEVEDVIERHESWWVVEKRGVARAQAVEMARDEPDLTSDD
ncbi:MAG: hypothetical protein JWM98_1583 [Thermoleophilia bacterium]|nr:hypothetical protein [Thermoleophilia bacterium]